MARSIVQAIDSLACGPGMRDKDSRSVVEALEMLSDRVEGISIYPPGESSASALSAPTDTTPLATPTISAPLDSPVIPTPDVSSIATPTTPPAKKSKAAVSSAPTVKQVPKKKRNVKP